MNTTQISKLISLALRRIRPSSDMGPGSGLSRRYAAGAERRRIPQENPMLKGWREEAQ